MLHDLPGVAAPCVLLVSRQGRRAHRQQFYRDAVMLLRKVSLGSVVADAGVLPPPRPNCRTAISSGVSLQAALILATAPTAATSSSKRDESKKGVKKIVFAQGQGYRPARSRLRRGSAIAEGMARRCLGNRRQRTPTYLPPLPVPP